jgi:hypothetical protein
MSNENTTNESIGNTAPSGKGKDGIFFQHTDDGMRVEITADVLNKSGLTAGDRVTFRRGDEGFCVYEKLDLGKPGPTCK